MKDLPTRLKSAGRVAALVLAGLVFGWVSKGIALVSPRAEVTTANFPVPALHRFRETHGRYPTTAEGLGAVYPNLFGTDGHGVHQRPLDLSAMPFDVFGRLLSYEGFEGGQAGFILVSAGPNPRFGDADDITVAIEPAEATRVTPSQHSDTGT